MEKEMQYLVKIHNELRVKQKKLMYDYDGLINVYANDWKQKVGKYQKMKWKDILKFN